MVCWRCWKRVAPGVARLRLRSLFTIYDVDDLIWLDLPWRTFHSIGFIERFLAKKTNASGFEFGSGASTIWLGRRAEMVVSVEHDPV